MDGITKEQAIKMIKADSSSFTKMSRELKADADVALAYVYSCRVYCDKKHIYKKHLKDRNFVIKAVAKREGICWNMWILNFGKIKKSSWRQSPIVGICYAAFHLNCVMIEM